MASNSGDGNLIYKEVCFRKREKIGVFHFFCLYTTEIIVVKIFLFFICPSSNQLPKKIFLGRRNTWGAFIPLNRPPPQVTDKYYINILRIWTVIRDNASSNAIGNCYAIITLHDLGLLLSVINGQAEGNKFGVQHQTANTHGRLNLRNAKHSNQAGGHCY
jgi:hypothetical protein